MLNIIVEDYKLNSFKSFLIISTYRLENFLLCSYKRIYFLLKVFFSLWKYLLGFQSQISPKAKIGRRIRLPHKAFGVVISAYAEINDDVTIYHLVTIGINENKLNKNIVIGSRCYLSVGSKVISCSLGDDVTVAPNAVVFKDCDKGGFIPSPGSKSV